MLNQKTDQEKPMDLRHFYLVRYIYYPLSIRC